jgi:hypothetical protein
MDASLDSAFPLENELLCLEPTQDAGAPVSERAAVVRQRGRPRGRSRGRGRGAPRHSAARSGDADGPTKGWRLKSVKETLREEKYFVSEMFSERARLFCSVGVERLEEELRCRELPSYRAGVLQLFMADALAVCGRWLNEKVVLDGSAFGRVTESDLLRYVSVLLLSHCTGFSLTKSIELLKQDGVQEPSLERVRFVSSNILAYSASGRGDNGQTTWNCSRDQSSLLSEFEKASFGTSCKIFLTPNHTFATLDDDLYGTRAVDNQVKTLSSRKADREGHCADALADALFRITLFVRFRRRGNSQANNVRNLLNCVLESRGEQSFHGFTITADRGYAKMSLVKELLKFDLGIVLVMPEHLIACHPFVGKSFLRTGRFGHDESDEETEECVSESDEIEEVNEGNLTPAAVPGVHYDRPRAFVVSDEPKAGPASFYAVKVFKRDTQPQRCPVTAVAVRERGTEKYSKVLRFAYRVSAGVASASETWVAVPGCGLSNHFLFVKRDDSGRIFVPPADSEALKDVVERALLEKCMILTIGQRCADWFVLRQFRVTGTNAGNILMSDNEVRTAIQYDAIFNSVQISSLPSLSSSDSTTLISLLTSWFSSSRSTEPMMRGSANEGSVLSALRKKHFVACLFEVGMIAKMEKQWMACSPDGIAVLKLDELSPRYGPNFEPSAATMLPWRAGESSSVFQGACGRLVLASVEIKTSVSSSSLQRSTAAASIDVTLCEIGDSRFKELVPESHVGQVLHQMIVLKCNYCLYVSAAETGILCIVVCYCADFVLRECERRLEEISGSLVSWAYTDANEVPEMPDPELRKIAESRICFWRLVNEHVRDSDAFYPPVKIFRHGMQSLYSKTKGGVDGSAQARAILRSPTSSFKWEQKIVSQTMKTLCVNAFIAWRMLQMKSRLQTKESFQDLERFRSCLNSVQSLADFVLDASKELLIVADKKEKEYRNDEGYTAGTLSQDNPVTDEEASRLIAAARSRKRYRIPFFNTEDGIKLRLVVAGHETKHIESERHCALCGNNSTTGGWRGHRSSFLCSTCNVHLCVRLHQGFRKNCWTIWHTHRRIELRVNNAPAQSGANDCNEGTSQG